MSLWLRYVTCIGCAGSAGVHAALVRPHLDEGSGALAAAFAAVAAVLAVLAVAAARPRHDRWALPAATALLVAVAAAYLMSRTTGLPGLLDRPEAIDAAGTLTTLVEALGAGTGVVLLTRTRRQTR